MIKKIEVSEEIKNIVIGIIYQYQHEWKKLSDGRDSLKQFNRLKIPKEDVMNDPSLERFVFTDDEKSIDEITSLLGADSCRNRMMYAKNTIMKWHTNSDCIGDRLYIIYTKEPGIFRYKDQTSGEIVDDIDNVGFTGRVFSITKNNPLWHCVWSPGRRFSLGFNFERGYNT